MKVSKVEVNYSPGMKDRRCGLCRYYHDEECSLVKGEINPQCWCDLWKAKTEGKK